MCVLLHSTALSLSTEVLDLANLLQVSTFLPGSREIFLVSLEMVPNFCCAESRDDFYRDGLWVEIYLEDMKNQISLALIYPHDMVMPSLNSSDVRDMPAMHWHFQCQIGESCIGTSRIFDRPALSSTVSFSWY